MRSLIIISVLVFCVACDYPYGLGEKKQDSSVVLNTVVKIEEVPLSEFDDIAKIICGKSFNSIHDSLYYLSFSESMRARFDEIQYGRLNTLRTWYERVKSLTPYPKVNRVFYPFSGGDFLHMYYTYPEANEYVMMAIEPVGKLPNFSRLPASDQDSALEQIQYMLRDVFKRSYFITKNMRDDIVYKKFIEGVLPMILWGIGITDHDIISMESASIDSLGQITTKHVSRDSQNFPDGVKLTFRKKGSNKVKTLVYLSEDISNVGIMNNKPLQKFIQNLDSVGSFIKAASYLCHYNGFSMIRDYILKKSVIHLQDDTGIPFKYFVDGNFSAMLYGVYDIPIEDFSPKLFQKDLATLYTDSTLYFGPLPFSMGYHWASKNQNQMVFFKNLEVEN